MNSFKYKLMQFMQGRRGIDELGKVLYLGSIVMFLAGILTRIGILYTIALALGIYYFYRAFSRNIYERQRENNKFLSYKKLWKLRYDERKVSRIFVCKGCGKYVRVPKGKGKIEITCRACGCKSIHRT